MKILSLCNFYPPVRAWGYAQSCFDVMKGLEGLGHDIQVVTSRHQRRTLDEPEPRVERALHLEAGIEHYSPLRFFPYILCLQRIDEARLRRVLRKTRPDVAMVWGMWNFSPRLPRVLELTTGTPVVYYFSDHWISERRIHDVYWGEEARTVRNRVPRRVLAALARVLMRTEPSYEDLRLEHALFVSHYSLERVLSHGRRHGDARVVHNGIDLDVFRPVNDREIASSDDSLRLVYSGQLVPHKGIRTAIQAMGHIRAHESERRVTLDVFGSGTDNYERELGDLAAAIGVEEQVTFWGRVTRDELASRLPDYDVFVFPTEYDEPLARAPQEAMALGLAVVGTATGGMHELFKDGVNCLLFDPRDARGLAGQILRLLDEPELRRAISLQGRRTIVEGFSLDRMVGRIERYLRDVVAKAESSC